MLFKNTKELQQYAELVAEINFDSLKATIAFVEDNHIKTVLGKEQYAILNTAYNTTAENDLDDEIKNLLEMCRKVIGPYTTYYYAPKSEVKLSDGGLRRNETATSKTAFQYQGTNFRQASLTEAESCTELLYQFLEDNKTDYEDWTDSDEFIEFRSLFIKTAKDFDKLFKSHSPYRNYYAMRSKMWDVEELIIRGNLGDDLFTHLKETDQSITETFTTKEKLLLEKLKKAIAHLTVSMAIPFLNVRIDSAGITIGTDANRSTNDEQSSRSAAKEKAISHIIRSAQDTGQAWLKNAIDFLNNNAADFEDWTVPEVKNTDGNCESNGSFGLY